MPPGHHGLESTSKDGTFCNSPISNFYCSGYERKYEYYGNSKQKSSPKKIRNFEKQVEPKITKQIEPKITKQVELKIPKQIEPKVTKQVEILNPNNFDLDIKYEVP